MCKAKLTKLSNRKLIEMAFTQIEEDTGFHIIDKQYGDTYFIAKGPKDSICHFHVKEIPGFLFAFWTTNRFDSIEKALESHTPTWADYYNISSESELVFFTQHERSIDKFKPSYSGFVQGIYRRAWYEKNDKNKRVKKEELYLGDVPDILEFMHDHPIKSYIYSGFGRDKVYYEISGLKALHIYLRDTYCHYKYKIKNKLKLNNLIKVSKKFVKKLKTMNYIIELEQGHSPEISIRLARKNHINTDDFKKDVNIIDKFEEKYFNSISIQTWFEYIVDNETLTPEIIKRDADLNRRFHSYAKSILDIIEGNSKETLEDYLIEKIITINIKEEE